MITNPPGTMAITGTHGIWPGLPQIWGLLFPGRSLLLPGHPALRPEVVAADLISLLENPVAARFLGWPERFFIKLNSIFPSLVDRALRKQLPVIRQHAIAPERGAG